MLHIGQIMQCSHCLRRADSCPGGGKGKLCKEKKTRRGEIADYMRHLRIHHNYVSLKIKYKEEFPQLDLDTHHDGFEHMRELPEESNHIDDKENPDDKAVIVQIQKKLSEANLAREQGVHEIAKLKASIVKQEHSMVVGMNKSKSGEINIRADNFEYDPENDTLKVLDEAQLKLELEGYCTATDKNKEKKINEMRRRVLSQVKGIEREKRGRRSSICSVKSVNSGFGTVRKRSEDDEEEIATKNIKLQSSSFLPTLRKN